MYLARARAMAMGGRGLRMYETLTLIRRSRTRLITPPTAAAVLWAPPPPPSPLMGRLISARPYCTSSSKLDLEEEKEEDDKVFDDKVFDEDSSSCLDSLEKAIHSVMVERCAPDWLPFKPGSSYWAPPLSQNQHPHAHKFIQLLTTLAHSLSDSDDEEALSRSTVRGWPSSSYFIQGTSSPHPVPSEVKVEVMVNKNSENAPQKNDEEG